MTCRWLLKLAARFLSVQSIFNTVLSLSLSLGSKNCLICTKSRVDLEKCTRDLYQVRLMTRFVKKSCNEQHWSDFLFTTFQCQAQESIFSWGVTLLKNGPNCTNSPWKRHIILFFIILIKCLFSLLLLHSVDPGGLAESCGLKPGQQLVDVNGVDFESICHALAVEIIRSSRQLVITMRVRQWEERFWLSASTISLFSVTKPSFSSFWE